MKRFIILFIIVFLCLTVSPMAAMAQKTATLTIAVDSTRSDTVSIRKGYYAAMLITPAGLGVALTINVSDLGTTFYTLQISYADSGAYTIEMDKSAAQAMILDKDVFYPIKHLYVTSGTTATEAETLTLILEKKR